MNNKPCGTAEQHVKNKNSCHSTQGTLFISPHNRCFKYRKHPNNIKTIGCKSVVLLLLFNALNPQNQSKKSVGLYLFKKTNSPLFFLCFCSLFEESCVFLMRTPVISLTQWLFSSVLPQHPPL